MEYEEKSVISKMLAVMFIAGFVLAGCATRGMKHTKVQTVPVKYDICVAEAVRIAAQAMHRVDFWVTKQNDAAGYLYGEMKKKDVLQVSTMTFYLEVHVGRDPAGGLNVSATSIAGPEVAFTTWLPNFVKDFYEAFDETLAAADAERPSKKPTVTFEKQTKPVMPITELPEEETTPEQKSSSKPAPPEYEL